MEMDRSAGLRETGPRLPTDPEAARRLLAPAHTAPSAGSVLQVPSSCPFSPTPVPPSPPWLKHPLHSFQAPAGSPATPTSQGCLQHAQGSEVGEEASDLSLTPIPSCSSLRARLVAALVSLSPSLPPPPRSPARCLATTGAQHGMNERMNGQERREGGRERKTGEPGVPCEPAPPPPQQCLCPPPRSPPSSHPHLCWGGGRMCKATVGDSNPRAALDPSNSFHEARRGPQMLTSSAEPLTPGSGWALGAAGRRW